MVVADFTPPISLSDIETAEKSIAPVIKKIKLDPSDRLSQLYNSTIYFKREDLQTVRSFKLRGAYNKMVNLTSQQKSQGVVCASAGNHAQGVAFSCSRLGIRGTIFMPIVTPQQKIERVLAFGNDLVEVKLIGDKF